MIKFMIFDEINVLVEVKFFLCLVKLKYGFIFNFMGELVVFLFVFEVYIMLLLIYGQISLILVEQQIVLLVISFENNCSYCMVVYFIVVLSVGLDWEVLLVFCEGCEIEDDVWFEVL